jgi:hypothetical protein
MLLHQLDRIRKNISGGVSRIVYETGLHWKLETGNNKQQPGTEY